MVIIRIDRTASLSDAELNLKLKGRWLVFLNLNMTDWKIKEAREISTLIAKSRPHDFNVLYSGKIKNIDKRILVMTDFILKKSKSKCVLISFSGRIVKRY